MKNFHIEDENINIYVGENAQDNWDLLDNSNQNSTWMHLSKFSSPYVIIDSKDPSKKIINYGACLCKQHSKYNNLKKIKVIYTNVKNVTKADKIGSVIIKGKTKEIII